MNMYGDISPRVGVRAASKLLKVGQPKMHLQRFAQIEVQPRRSGQTIKFRRYHSFPLITAPAAEGVTPQSQKLFYTDITATVRQYVSVTDLTDVIEDTHEDPVLQVMMQRMGEQFAASMEVIGINVLKAGTNVFFTGTATTRGTVTAAMSRGDFRRVRRALMRARAQEISEIIAPTSKVGTMGVLPGYFAMGHTDLESDIQNLIGFKSVVEYATPEKRIEGEIGACERVRFILSDLWEPWYASGANSAVMLSNGDAPGGAVACDVYPLVIVAQDAYGCVRLQGREAVQISVLNPNTPRGDDPAGQKGWVSWKTWMTYVILNQAWMARLETPATANPA